MPHLLNQSFFSYDYDLASHTTHVVCVNFIQERWDQQFEKWIFKKTFRDEKKGTITKEMNPVP